MLLFASGGEPKVRCQSGDAADCLVEHPGNRVGLGLPTRIGDGVTLACQRASQVIGFNGGFGQLQAKRSDPWLSAKEVEYIRLYRANDPRIGYNRWPKPGAG